MDREQIVQTLWKNLELVDVRIKPYRQSEWITPQMETDYAYLLGQRNALEQVLFSIGENLRMEERGY